MIISNDSVRAIGMNQGNWGQVEDLVIRASALPAADRQAFLERECQDHAIRREAASLLEHLTEDTVGLASAVSGVVHSMVEAVPDSWIGRQLGSYHLTRLIGRGGMGAVYEAHRKAEFQMRAAIKVVRTGFDSDALLERLRRERQILALLDHPHIARLLDGGTVEGVPYLVMEYIEGRPIAEYCRLHNLGTNQRLELFEKIARAVHYAHQHGVVHRDLKPANILVTDQGMPKLLDFGIAKLLDHSEFAEAGAMTATGLGLMTPDYASPEQMLGEKIGPPSDIYSLGAVLFELVTDERARAGAQTDTLAPSRVAKNRSIGRDLDHIVAKAMRKNPAERYASADALAADVDRYLAGDPVLARRSVWAYRVKRWLVRRRLAFGVALVAASLGLLLALAYRYYRQPIHATWSFAKLSEESGELLFPALAPDGHSYVYCQRHNGEWDILWTGLGPTASARNLTEGAGADNLQPAFSPDGRAIAFRSERAGGGIFVLDLETRRTRRVSRAGFNPSWSADGKQLVAATESILFPDARNTMKSLLLVIDIAGGSTRRLLDTDAVQPNWSPHGWRIAYWNTEGGRRNIYTVSAAGPNPGHDPQPVTSDAQTNWNPVWSADGALLVFASDRGGSMNLWEVPIDERSGRVTGPPRAIATPSIYSGHLSAARQGMQISYMQVDLRSNLHAIGFDARTQTVSGQPQLLTQGARQATAPDWSPDGKEIVFQDIASRQEDLYVIGSDGSGLRRLTQDAFRDRIPRWSPRGDSILFYSNRSGRYDLWRIGPHGENLQPMTATNGPSVLYAAWSRDGQWIGYNVLGSSPYLVRTAQLGKPGSYPGEKMPDLGPATTAINDWSPDGKLIAGFAGSGGIVTFDVPARQYHRWTATGRDALWLRDGYHLLYRDNDHIYSLNYRTGKSTLVLSVSPQKLSGRFTISPDETRLGYAITSSASDLWLTTAER